LHVHRIVSDKASSAHIFMLIARAIFVWSMHCDVKSAGYPNPNPINCSSWFWGVLVSYAVSMSGTRSGHLLLATFDMYPPVTNMCWKNRWVNSRVCSARQCSHIRKKTVFVSSLLLLLIRLQLADSMFCTGWFNDMYLCGI
jgi:hypothetical protein